MTVDVEGNGHTAMPEHCLYCLGRFPQLQHQCGKGMPGIVDTARWQPCLLYDPIKGSEKISWVNGLAICLAEDQSMILICLPKEQLFFRLPCLVLFQGCQTFFRDRDSTARWGSLGLLKDESRSALSFGARWFVIRTNVCLHAGYLSLRQRLSSATLAIPLASVLSQKPERWRQRADLWRWQAAVSL